MVGVMGGSLCSLIQIIVKWSFDSGLLEAMTEWGCTGERREARSQCVMVGIMGGRPCLSFQIVVKRSFDSGLLEGNTE